MVLTACGPDASVTAPGDPPTGRAALDAQALRRRWDLVLPHREELLAIARRRVASREDAEDVVATALLRTVEHPGLDESRVGAFLCTTVTRLAVDVDRDRARQLAVGKREATRQLPPPPIEETVCDEAEARWLARELRSCPPREQQVLQARLGGLSARETSLRLNLTAKATENALTRVRQRASGFVAATMALAGVMFAAGRRLARPSAMMVPVATVAALAVIALPEQAEPPTVTAPVVTLESNQSPAPPDAALPTTAVPPVIADQPRPVTDAMAAVEAPAVPAASQPPAPSTTQRIEAPLPESPADVVLPPDRRPYAEERHQDEDFDDSLQRCVENVDLTDPTADPCR